jgi:flavorubredoxin
MQGNPPRVTEIAPDIFQISIFAPEINLQFNAFLVRDEEPLLFHTLFRRWVPLMREGLSRVIDPSQLRWISFSHFEMDECGALNEWLAEAPRAEAAHNFVGVNVNLHDFSNRPARVLMPEDRLTTGKYTFRYIHTPQLPHGWDAGVMFEEKTRTLFCSDLFHHGGDVEPVTEQDVLDRVRAELTAYQVGPLAGYVPFTRHTEGILRGLAELRPRTIATQHGSTYVGDGERALLGLSRVMREVLGGGAKESAAAE